VNGRSEACCLLACSSVEEARPAGEQLREALALAVPMVLACQPAEALLRDHLVSFGERLQPQQVLLDVGCQAQQIQDLRDATPGNVCVARQLQAIEIRVLLQEALEFDGHCH